MTDTREAILSAARSMAQAHGYRGLRFRDIAAEVGVTSASVHHHFALKEDLGVAVAKRYWEEAEEQLHALWERHFDPSACMDHYPRLFRRALVDGNRLGLHGVMVAEHDDLPDAVRTEMGRFADINLFWLAEILLKADPDIERGAADSRARAIFSAVSGAQLVARGRADVTVFDDVIESFREVGLFSVGPGKTPRPDPVGST